MLPLSITSPPAPFLIAGSSGTSIHWRAGIGGAERVDLTGVTSGYTRVVSLAESGDSSQITIASGETTITSPGATATNTLTVTGNFSDGETVTAGSQVYTFRTVLGTDPGDVLIGATGAITLSYLAAAINNSAGGGTFWANSTPENTDVHAGVVSGSTLPFTAVATNSAAANEIPTTTDAANAAWESPHMDGGYDPGAVTPTADGFDHEGAPVSLTRVRAILIRCLTGHGEIGTNDNNFAQKIKYGCDIELRFPDNPLLAEDLAADVIYIQSTYNLSSFEVTVLGS